MNHNYPASQQTSSLLCESSNTRLGASAVAQQLSREIDLQSSPRGFRRIEHACVFPSVFPWKNRENAIRNAGIEEQQEVTEARKRRNRSRRGVRGTYCPFRVCGCGYTSTERKRPLESSLSLLSLSLSFYFYLFLPHKSLMICHTQSVSDPVVSEKS